MNEAVFSDRNHVRNLMAEIGPLMELHSVIEVDDGDLWLLKLGAEEAIVAEYLPEDDRLFLTADVGVPYKIDRTALYEALLMYNDQWRDTGGVRMALDPRILSVHLICDFAAAGLDAGSFHAVLESFVRKRDAWVGIVAAEPDLASGADEGSPPDDAIRV